VPSSEGLPTRLAVTQDGPHPSPELVTSPARSELRRARWPCPLRALVWAALGPQPGRERPECLGQPQGTPSIICSAQHPFPAKHRRPRSPADSPSHGGSRLKSIRSWPVRAQHRAYPGLRSRASGIPTRRPRSKMPSGVKPATWLMTPARHSACARKQGQWYGSAEPPIMR
jgi:hypothetical protein